MNWGQLMNINCIVKNRRRLTEAAIFLLVMGLSFYTVFHGHDLREIFGEIRKLSFVCLCGAVMTAVFFVCAEGCMIYYLLRSLDGKSGLLRCISYSFIGFFYSGITPSATGGQPVQLYYMKKDGNGLADSSVVLMVVALLYKFVLVICGIFMLLFWYQQLRCYLQGYFGVYLFGLALNVILVAVLFCVMIMPERMKQIILRAEKLLEKRRIWKPSMEREKKAVQFVDSYQNAVRFFAAHKKKVCVVTALTFLQRCSVFFLTYIIYRGFALQGTDVFTIVFLQAAIYIAVDMLPIPGAQGITEMMYQSVFKTVFPQMYLMSSLYVTRGISFYFLLFVSMVVVIGNWLYRKGRYCRKDARS